MMMAQYLAPGILLLVAIATNTAFAGQLAESGARLVRRDQGGHAGGWREVEVLASGDLAESSAQLKRRDDSVGTESEIKVTFLVRTGGPESQRRLSAIRSTWGKHLPKRSLQLLAPDSFCNKTYGDNHGPGLTCLEAVAELKIMQRKDFDWLVVVDDDVYVHLGNLVAQLENIATDVRAVWGIPGCGHCDGGASGLCGGGGYAVSRVNLVHMASAGWPPTRLEKHTFMHDFMSGPDTEWCDVRFACVAQHHGLHLKLLGGLYGWNLSSAADLDAAMRSTDVPPITFHCAYYPQFERREDRDEDEDEDESQVTAPFQAKSSPDFMRALHARFEEISAEASLAGRVMTASSLVEGAQNIRRATATEYERQLQEYILKETRVRRRPDVE